MNRSLLLLALLFAATPAHAKDLSGLWRVDGKLPDGTRLRGVAALSPDKDSAKRFRILAYVKLDSGRRIAWRAVAERSSSTLSVRHVGVSGLAKRIVAVRKPPGIRASYKLSKDDKRFAGRYRLDRTAKGGELRYRKVSSPKVTARPTELRVRIGNEDQLRLSCDPAIALPLLGVDGEGVTRVYSEKGRRVARIEPKRRGAHTLRVRLGAGGQPLLEVPLRVLPSYLDAVRERIRKIRAKQRTPIVVFDIDDTIVDTRQRTRDLLQAFGSKANEPRLSGLKVAQVRYRIQDTLAAAGLSKQEIEGELGQKAIAEWTEKFKEPAFYTFDRADKGASRAANAFSDAGARIVYLTERFKRGLGATRSQLAEAGFPDGAIMCKPTRQQAPAFKELQVAELNRVQGEVAACFDNDPATLNAIKRAAGDALVFQVLSMAPPDGPKLGGGIEPLRRFSSP